MPFTNEDCYCAPCDLYFPSLQERSAHIQATATHPECDYCKRRFLNKNTLRNHYIYSRHHHYCAACEIEFQSAAGLRYHIEHAPVHCDDSDEEEDAHDDPSIPSHEWEDEMGQMRYPEEPPQSDDEDSDNSWEAYDDYDYEDAEELHHLGTEEVDESEDEDDADGVELSCPLCCKTPNSVCCTPCGHIFCPPCITRALRDRSECPICAEPGTTAQLRKIFLA